MPATGAQSQCNAFLFRAASYGSSCFFQPCLFRPSLLLPDHCCFCRSCQPALAVLFLSYSFPDTVQTFKGFALLQASTQHSSCIVGMQCRSGSPTGGGARKRWTHLQARSIKQEPHMGVLSTPQFPPPPPARLCPLQHMSRGGATATHSCSLRCLHRQAVLWPAA